MWISQEIWQRVLRWSKIINLCLTYEVMESWLRGVNSVAIGGVVNRKRIVSVFLKYVDYPVVLLLTSFTYVWTMVFSYLIFREKYTVKKTVGVLMILIGVFVYLCRDMMETRTDTNI